ncbi:MAG TPA: S8 family serine peptidase [Bryobacteraceae bacterium]|nr:S8 family serine peptidase [Bryobacteraceae bacterium]
MPAAKLLIKSRPMEGTAGQGRSAAAAAAFAVGKTPLQVETLFPERAPAEAKGVTAPAVWHSATLPEELPEAEMWDLCHTLSQQGMGMAGGVAFAEPDLSQSWKMPLPEAAAMGLAGGPAAFNTKYPAPDPFDWRWFQDSSHSGLQAAASAFLTVKERVTIAHLDTGYREGHTLRPAYLDEALARSFVEKDPDPNSAYDPFIGGVGNNPGHGTATLCILAGNRFDGAPFGNAPSGYVGGAPFARVIPIRVANSVVAFTNSSIAKGFEYAIRMGVDVVSMSMGGVPSQLWAELINEAYEKGITVVTAAGNNFGPGKVRVPRFIVYPARFRRVIAACGAMYDGKPYADFFDPRMMAGSYGPGSKMATAMAAFTPNTPWANYNDLRLIDFSGSGTSSATPQIAAAAACWLQKYREDPVLRGYAGSWKRVEAVRRALFSSADNTNREYFGNGLLRADKALAEAPGTALGKQDPDTVDVPVLGPVLSVLFGAAESSVRHRMLRVEAAQVAARDGELENLAAQIGLDPDLPPDAVPAETRRRFLEALADSRMSSQTLKAAAASPVRKTQVTVKGVDLSKPVAAETYTPPDPHTRCLRVFAFDPVLRLRLETERINETALPVRWEKDLRPGPVGEYLEVVDVDPSTGACYAPVDLNHPSLLASDGLAPAEGVPQFHQQMVYAVAMTTIQRFEDALGRTALWAPRLVRDADGRGVSSHYVQRLRIYPHALREANAYYSPAKSALLFGYFQANSRDAVDNLPGGLVFTCLSHDVVAHETTHALVDGLHRYYQYQTNEDIAAFHEAFADIVALFQHFSIPAALRHVIAKSRGDLRKDNILADLAQQFGQASSGSRSLRSGLGGPPKATDYANATESHERGAVLLAAVFQAFLEIYEARVEDLKRLATGGTGVLPPGEISIDLVNRLAKEAAASASRVLTTCIRALDYCPPIDLTFGDYLRALITADMDLEPDDEFNIRTAFLSGFRARGIFPSGVRNLSEENLRWQPPRIQVDAADIQAMVKDLELTWDLNSDRRESYSRSESNGYRLWKWLRALPDDKAAALQKELGVFIHAGPDMPEGVALREDGTPKLHLRVRPARRITSRNQQMTDLVVEAVQRFTVTDPESKECTTHRGGCTLLIDVMQGRIRYAIRKRVCNAERAQEEKRFLARVSDDSPAYFTADAEREPFAMLHRGL